MNRENPRTRLTRALCVILICLGGQTAFAQFGWYERGVRTSPPEVRFNHGLAFDSVRNRTVLFGGAYWAGMIWRYLADTWEWDGTIWIDRTSTGPSPRAGHAVAFDSARGLTVLFGGSLGDGGQFYNDTWEWDGTTWTRRTPATTTPPGRDGHILVYDSARRRTVLFGGRSASGPMSDTWEWDGADWRPRNVPGPLARFRHAAAYDSARQRTVLFGGGIVHFNDTWEFDGTTWGQHFVGGFPAARWGHALAYDPQRQVTVLFGGNAGGLAGDTHEWNGTAWAFRSLQSGPPARHLHSLAYDSSRQRMVLFGGDYGYQVNGRVDTWELHARPSYCRRLGIGHNSSRFLELNWTGPPAIGTTWNVSFANVPPWPAGFNLLVIGTRLPQAAVLDAGVCERGYMWVGPMVVLEAMGNPASFGIGIPYEPNLVGVDVFCIQGGSFEISGCFRLTDALQITIQ